MSTPLPVSTLPKVLHPLRPMVRRVRRSLRELRAALWRKFGPSNTDWNKGVPEEMRFWAMALSDQGRHWNAEEFRRRTDPRSEFQPELQALIPTSSGDTVRLLDVGAGPLTTLGSRWPNRDLRITALDPLAAEYAALLARLGIQPPVVTSVGEGEKLSEQFPTDHFDLAYSCNALDHSRDPVIAIAQMLAVVKPGRFVYLWHFANEGLCECYTGMHQWNFDTRGNEFLIGDGRTTRSLGTELAGRASLTCEEQTAFGKRVVVARLRKV